MKKHHGVITTHYNPTLFVLFTPINRENPYVIHRMYGYLQELSLL